jgi:ribosomal protein S27AE
MPYTHCPSCRLSIFSVARHSSRDECPRCGTELRAHPRRLFLVPEPEADHTPLSDPPAADAAPEVA